MRRARIKLFFIQTLLIIGTMSIHKVCGQETDPILVTATIAAEQAENSEYDAIKSKQDIIKAAQDATVVAVSAVNAIQNKIYNGLQQVSSIVKNAYQIKEATTTVSDILSYESDMLSEAKKNPIAIIFAASVQNELGQKAVAYFADISGFILAANKADLLMDAGERDRLLYKILLDLQHLRALAAYSYYKVHLAVMQGIINSLNPFKGYVDLDGNIVKDLLSNWKH